MTGNQMPVPDEMLAEALAYAAAESKFKEELTKNDIFVPEDKITLAWTEPQAYYQLKNPFQSSSVQMQTQLFDSAIDEAKKVFFDVMNWLKKKFTGAAEKLKELAEKILDLAKNFAITVIDVLSRMRKFIFKWVIGNSALPSVVISDETYLSLEQSSNPLKIPLDH